MNEHLRDWSAKTPAEVREAVATKAGTTVGRPWQLAGGHQKASAELAERLQEASDCQTTIAGLRPDLVPLARKVLKGVA